MSDFGGFWIRFVGLILDSIIVGSLIFLAIAIFNLDTASQAVQTGEGIASLLYFILVPALWYGYTIGKRIVGIRIAKTNGTKVTIGTMLLRYFVSGLVYSLSLGLAFIVSIFMVAIREDKRAIHDFIAGTYVTYKKA